MEVANWKYIAVGSLVEGLLDPDSPEALCCVGDQDTLSSAYISTGSAQEDRKVSRYD